MKILYVAYPLLPVTEQSPGGAEQMLSVLEEQMHRRGHQTAVAACDGSRVAGTLLATGSAPAQIDGFDARSVEHNTRVVELVCREHPPFDLLHDKSGHFWRSASAVDVAVLATLHLPRSFYPPDAFADLPANVFFNCVSDAQAQSFADLPGMLGVAHNGIALERFPFHEHGSEYLLWLGRICEEKGTHIALDVAAGTQLPIVIAGALYPFSYHREYFAREVAPRLAATPHAQFIEQPTMARKIELLANARAVLVPSLAPETSSLIAMEAAACGTPVVAFRRGALPEVVADGQTGFVVDEFREMVNAVWRCGQIDRLTCRDHAERHFDCRRMADDYERLYELIRNSRRVPAPSAETTKPAA